MVRMQGPVFLSYSRADRAYVEKLASHLESAGVPVWWDFEIRAGEAFAREIQQRIDACAAVLVVLSPAAAASKWVSRETHYADERDKTIVPLLLEPCPIPFLLTGLHREDVRGGRMPQQATV